jgi:uncharacterized membrane protein YfcA
MPDLLLLALGGLAGGFLVGLVGVGGGIVYAPVLLVAYQHRGIEDPVLTPLVLGTSLFCVGLAAASGAVAQWRAGAVEPRVALVSGAVAAVTVPLTGRFVTTQPWYDREAFAVVFGLLLVGVALRMLLEKTRDEGVQAEAGPAGPGALVGAGAAAGALSAVAGVGGGVVLVPLYHNLLRLSTKAAVATSTAAIVLIAAVGVATYAVLGWGTPGTTLGYVDPVYGVALALPAMLTARLGVYVGHRLPARTVRVSFACIALVVAARLLWGVLA